MVDLKSMILVVQVKLNLVTDFVTIMTMMIMIKKVLYDWLLDNFDLSLRDLMVRR